MYKHKGTRSDPSCFRPVVLLPCVSKVFESLVKDQLQAHCLKMHAIPDEQFGFLPQRSTVWQLLSGIVHSTLDPQFMRVSLTWSSLSASSIKIKSNQIKWPRHLTMLTSHGHLMRQSKAANTRAYAARADRRDQPRAMPPDHAACRRPSRRRRSMSFPDCWLWR